MTMPEKIYAWEYRGNTPWGEQEPSPKFTKGVQAIYIRADIAEDLARALEGVMHYVNGHAGSDEQGAVEEALTNFRAVTNK